ncbi:Uncharacterised protein [Acinetobacter baumannii]|nr:hypothetical protein DU202_01595 [Acinetobacter baumannii DU202]SSU31872.1 Uncharacterised protein [Acinetobacter baumannii]SSU31899.1 Uncharacterised protein [Acinetobacter baumannii]SSU40634.1 Uncharacterised protein [Acinetobacter baumannii]SSU46107.1 Uncharacterised protein [Acinetobacter baumannii]
MTTKPKPIEPPEAKKPIVAGANAAPKRPTL